MIAATSSMAGAAHCFLIARSSAESPGGGPEVEVEVVELTKRQRGLVGGGCEVLGHKIKPLTPDGKPDPGAKSWCIAWSEAEAAAAYADLTEAEPCVSNPHPNPNPNPNPNPHPHPHPHPNQAEPCVYVAADGVYVATRMKRALCKGLSAPMKSAKEVKALVRVRVRVRFGLG